MAARFTSTPFTSNCGSNEGIRRSELFIGIGLCLLANHALQIVDSTSITNFLSSLASQNLIYWFACYVILYRLFRSKSKFAATRLDLVLTFLACVAIIGTSFIAYRFTIGVLVSCLAVWILSSHRGDQSLRAAGMVLMALSVHLVWAPVFFRFFMSELLLADAAAINVLLTSLRPDIVQVGTSFIGEEHAVTLIGACSSFHNISIAILASVSATMLVRSVWVRTDILWLGAVCGAMVLVNVSRIAALAWDFQTYQYWHDGPGVQILALAQTAIIASIALWGAKSVEVVR